MPLAEACVYGDRMTDDTSVPSVAATAMPAEHTLGVGLIVASSAFFAMAGIFTKSISTDPWTIACWRGLVGGLLITAYVLWRSGRGAASASISAGAAGRWSSSACSPPGLHCVLQIHLRRQRRDHICDRPADGRGAGMAVPARPSAVEHIGDGPSLPRRCRHHRLGRSWRRTSFRRHDRGRHDGRKPRSTW